MACPPSWASLDTNECRKLGYSISSAFEESLRDFIFEICQIECGKNWKNELPKGVLISIDDKLKIEDINLESIDNIRELLEYSDFPHLKEILLTNKFKNHIKEFTGYSNHEVFINNMDEIYVLRNKISHVKRHFSYYSLTRLIGYVEELSQGKSAIKFIEKLNEIKNTKNVNKYNIPDKYLIYENKKCPENLPSPDYEIDGGFIGRKDIVKKIKAMLYSDLDRVITISGAGGVGKTALALETIYNILDEPKNPYQGMVWISAKKDKLTPIGIEPMDIVPIKTYDLMLNSIIETLTPEVYDSLFKFISYSLKTSDKKILDNELYVNKLFENNKYLLIVDNLETIKDDRIINFIKDIPRPHKVLITSRRGLGEIERRYELKELTENEAITLFRVISREKNLLDLMRSDDKIIKKYVNKVQRYPLAIKWCLGQVALGKDIQEVFSRDPNSDLVKFCFEDVFSMLSYDAKKILYGISIFHDPPSKPLLSHVTDLNFEIFEDEIRNLVLTSLVIPEQVTMGDELVTKYNMLSLTKDYIENKLNEDKELKYVLYERKEELDSVVSEAEKAKVLYEYSLFGDEPSDEKEKIALIKSQTAYNFSQSNNYNDAIKEMEEALKIAPKYATVYRYYAIIESDFHNIEKANELMDTATKIDPNNDFLWFIWGNINKRYKRNSEARKYIEKAINIKPFSFHYLNTYGYLLKDMGLYKESYEIFLTALEKEYQPKDKIISLQGISETLRKWSQLLYTQKKYNEAIEKINESEKMILNGISIDDNDRELNTTYKYILLEKGRLLTERKGIQHGKESFLKCLADVKNISKRNEKRIIGYACYNLVKNLYNKKSDDIHLIIDCLNYCDKGMNSLEMTFIEYSYLRNIKEELIKHKEYLESIRLKTKGIVKYYNKKGYGIITKDNIEYAFRLKDFEIYIDKYILDNMVGKTVYFEIQPRIKSKRHRAIKIIPNKFEIS